MTEYRARIPVWGYKHDVLLIVRAEDRWKAYGIAQRYARVVFGPNYNTIPGVRLEDRRVRAA